MYQQIFPFLSYLSTPQPSCSLIMLAKDHLLKLTLMSAMPVLPQLLHLVLSGENLRLPWETVASEKKGSHLPQCVTPNMTCPASILFSGMAAVTLHVNLSRILHTWIIWVLSCCRENELKSVLFLLMFVCLFFFKYHSLYKLLDIKCFNGGINFVLCPSG